MTQTILITGASSGYGRATAQHFLDCGWNVAAAMRKPDAALFQGALERLRIVRMDVTDEASIESALDAAEAAFGGVDVLVNNAGLGATATVVEMTDEQWQNVIDVSLTGTMRMTRAALKRMMPRKAGVIVNNASVLAWRAQAGQSAYAAAKAGVLALTRCSAIEAAPAGIRINAVSPSIALHKHLVKVTTQDVLDTLTSREAFGRGAEPWEVANVIVFLASDYASYMTGEVISVSSQHP